MGKASGVFGNVVILGVMAAWAWLNAYRGDVYYQTVQEDALLEWITFWGFAVGCVAFLVAGYRQYRQGRIPWFLVGMALLSFFIAMEEISWGQRLLGYRPPDYFLAENFQQELNLHNIAGRSLRKGAFRAILLGYGVILPALQLYKPTADLLKRFAIVPPPIWLAPSFLAMFVLDVQYPWKFTGELVEAALGLGFLIAALANVDSVSAEKKRPLIAVLATALVLVSFLGVGSAYASQRERAPDPEKARAARDEAEALKHDLIAIARSTNRAPTKCGLHKRIYSFVEKYDHAAPLRDGTFVTTVTGATERAEFFIDPWNSPYWVRDKCNKKKRKRSVFVYSFGPNRQRDSTEWEIQGDDIGVYLRR